MKRRLWKLVCVLILALGLISSSVPALAEKGSPGTDVQQLANRVRKVIKQVEENPTITCEMRNHLVKRLRMLDDALESGNRTAARALVMAWTGEAHSYQAAGLLSAEHGAILDNGLHGFLDEIGVGTPDKPGPTRKWDPLPVCDSTVGSGSYEVWDPNDSLTIVKTVLGYIPTVGPLLSCIAQIFWPSSGPDISDLIDQALDDYTYQQASDALLGLQTELGTWSTNRDNWITDCADKRADIAPCQIPTAQLYSTWDQVNTNLVGYRIKFQTADSDNQLMLLPLFAQYETFYMAFLRDGILLAPAWIEAGTLPSNAGTPAKTMTEDLNPDFVDKNSVLVDPETMTKMPDRGTGYVNYVYNRGLDAKPQPTSWDNWVSRNRYIRDNTLKVLDFRDTWSFFDPAAYPNGVKGGVKLTRMIYSDPVGHIDSFSSFQPPANVPGPLKELTVWSQNFDEFYYGSTRVISAAQSTSPPTAGPVQSGPITGDATHDSTTYADFLDLGYSGPVTEVQVKRDKRINVGYEPWIPTEIAFKLVATGTWWRGGNSGGGTTLPWLGTDPTQLPTDVRTFSYQGNVLASVKAMGVWDYWYKTAESLIFGFRLYDSFFPSGALVNVRSGKCMDVRYLTAGTGPTIYSCFSGSPAGQIWTYNTNTKQVMIGDLCLRATGTVNGSAIEINVCTGEKNQQWELAPGADGLYGLIKSVESGLALDVAGGGTADRTPIVLWYPHGDTNQQWTVTSQVTGEIHGIGSGRCLDVKSDNTTNGTPVQIYDCNGTTAQAWKYDEGARTLSVHNGTKCLDANGTAAGAELMIWDCSGAANQQWTFGSDGHITQVSTGLVLNVKSGGMTNGAPVILWTRTTGPQQKWSRPSRLGRHVHAMYAGKCLEVPKLDSGTQAQVNVCLPSPVPGQEWTYHPLTQRLTIHGDGTEKCLSTLGAAVVIDDCIADANQLWTLQDNGIGGTIISTPSMDTDSPLCMTLPGTTRLVPDGTKVEVQPCPASDEPANPNQQWIWP